MLNEHQGFRKYADITAPGDSMIIEVVGEALAYIKKHGYKPTDFVVIEVKREHQV